MSHPGLRPKSSYLYLSLVEGEAKPRADSCLGKWTCLTVSFELFTLLNLMTVDVRFGK